MSTAAIIVLVVAVVVVLGLVAWFLRGQQRRRDLRQRFGPEYDRAVAEGDSRKAAERELTERQKRHAELDVRPLSAASRERFSQQWSRIQEEFVDQPGDAVAEADRLVAVVMGERGYPTDGYEQQVSDLSVRHAETLQHYRSAHEVMVRHEHTTVSTEELREAMVHYRAMFHDLLGTDESEVDGQPTHARRG